MKCARCGQSNAAGAKFCQSCGLPVGVPASQPAPQPAYRPVAQPSPQPAVGYQTGIPMAPFTPQKQKTWPWVLGAVLAGVVALAGLRAAGLLKFGQSVPDPSLRAGAKMPTPLLQSGAKTPAPTLEAAATVPPPVLDKGAVAGPTMPKDVYAWLKWLEQIEKEKRALTEKEETQLSTLTASLQAGGGLTPQGVRDLTNPDNPSNSAPAVDETTKVAKQIIADWQTLKTKFDSYPPPQECVPIGQAFDNGLEGTAANAQKLLDLVQSIGGKDEPTQDDANTAIGSAKDVGKHHVNDVDAELTSTDRLVQDICSKYNTQKWFSIDAHGGGRSMFSVPGM